MEIIYFKIALVGVDVKRIESIVKENISLIRNLDNIKADREKGTVESIYYKIDDNRYIEKRDGKQFLVTIDPNGEIQDKPYNMDIDRIYSITPVGKSSRVPKNIGDIDSLKMDLIIDRLHRSMDSKDYRTILQDAPNPFSIKDVFYTKDVDMRSREVNFSKYIADLKSILFIIPENKQDEFVNDSVEKLLKDIYGVPKNENVDLYSRMQNNVKKALNNKNADLLKNNVMDLNQDASTLNKIRRTRVEEDKKHSLVGFNTPEAKLIYTINQKAMRKRQLEAEEKEFIKNSDTYMLNEEYLGKDEYFPGVYIVGAFNCISKASVDVDKMANGIKGFIQRYPEKEQRTKAQELSRKLLRKYYGRESSRTIPGIDDERSSIYDQMQAIVCGQIFNGKAIDVDNFNELEQNMHNIVSKEFDYYHARSLIGFKDEQTKSAYEQYSTIQSRTDIPQDIKGGMLSQLKALNKSRLKSNRLLSKIVNLTEGKCRTSQINEEVGKIRNIITEKNRDQSLTQ